MAARLTAQRKVERDAAVLRKHDVGREVMDSLIAAFDSAVARNGDARAAA